MLIAYVLENKTCQENLIRKGLMGKNAGDRNLLSYFRVLQVSQGNAPSRILSIQYPDSGGKTVFLKREGLQVGWGQALTAIELFMPRAGALKLLSDLPACKSGASWWFEPVIVKGFCQTLCYSAHSSYVQDKPLEKVFASVFPGNGFLASGWFCIINLGNWVKLVEARVVFVRSLAQQILTYDLVTVCTVVLWKSRYPC